MHKYYNDYHWKNGKPYGRTNSNLATNDISYRVVTDPYYKRFSLEEYKKGQFSAVLYDSALFDFRHLRQPEQASWQKVAINSESSLIKNHDDRVILIEKYLFEGELCRECKLFSTQGYHLSTHKMHWETLGDPFNGVILFDTQNKIIMKKTYAMQDNSLEYGELLSESWEC